MNLLALPIVKYTLRAALRDKLIMIMVVALVLATSLSVFLASAAITEKDFFAIVFIAGSLRIFLSLGMILFSCFFVRRLFENREIEYLLTRPVSRVGFIFSISFAFCVIALFFAGLGISCILYTASDYDIFSYSIWSLSLAVELLIVVNAGLFFSMVITSAAGSALATIGFYVFARLIGQLIAISENSVDIPGGPLMEIVITTISMFMPRLDLLSQTSWLVYGVNNIHDITFTLLHGFIFVPLLMAAASFDLVRREF